MRFVVDYLYGGSFIVDEYETESYMARKNIGLVVDLDDEQSIGEVGIAGKVVPTKSTRKTGTPRPTYEEALKCPNCQGRMHMNLPVSTVNFECLYRQFCLGTKRIDTPDEKLPVFTADEIEELSQWTSTRRKSRKSPLSYGKMAPEGSAPSTYAAMRASKSVDEVAGEVEVKAKKRTAKAEAVIPVQAPAKGGKNSTKPEPVRVKSNGKASKQEFSMESASFELDEDETEVPVRVSKIKASTKSKPEPVRTPTPIGSKATLKKLAKPEPVRATAAQKMSKANRPLPTATSKARKAALAARGR